MVSANDWLGARAPAEGLCVVGASAGSGKTHHLTQVVLRALQADLQVEGLVAVTYTTRAAAELRSRIRQALVREGRSESALRLPLARVGTVHAVCLGWVEDFAIDAGLPPAVRVLPDDGGLQFRRLLEQSIPAELQARLSQLGRDLQIKWDGGKSRSDWLWHVFEMIDLARANRIAPSALPAMAQRSIAWLSELLPPPSESDLEHALRDALERAIGDLERSDDRTQVTTGALQSMKAARRRFSEERAAWKDWAALAALDSAKPSRDVVEGVRSVAAQFEAHPRFQHDLRQMIEGVFQCAQLGLERYQSWKRRLRLIDYVDMLERTLELLERRDVADELAGRLRMVVVDEFQDTSPIQLELFLRLHQLTRRSTWVGDRKQCIFEFAGADPRLMDSVTRWVSEQGGTSEQLPSNYRSRPELVSLCSELFARALAPYGYARAEVAVSPQRRAPSALAPLPPVGIFSLETSNAEQHATALAAGIQRLLSLPAATPIVDRSTGATRELRAGDVAVLVRTNAEAEALARELGQLGIRAALARPGLLGTPEGTLVDAALSYLLDPWDGVAAATLDALHGFRDGDADRWLDEQIRVYQARRDAAAARQASKSAVAEPPEPANDVSPDATEGWRAALSALATRTRHLSPRETLDAVIPALDLHRIALGWPDPDQRSGNLDALRALASQYEDTCRVKGAAATLGGLLHHFDRAREARWDGNEMRASDEQHFSQGPNAVALCTYHRAKGLEWPVVILSSLDAAARADAFGVSIEAPEGPLNPERPLEGRWIRYVPRPLTNRRKNLGFVEREEQSPEGQRARHDERCERARLLYVGFTRARDHLIFAARSSKGALQSKWLDELQNGAGKPLLRLPARFDDEAVSVGVEGTDLRVPGRAWHIELQPPAALPANDTSAVLTWKRPTAPVAAREPYRIAPSSAAHGLPGAPSLRVAELIRIAPPVSVRRRGDVDWAAFGDTVHGFLAADDADDDRLVRSERAERLLAACTSGASVEAEALLGVSDALRAFVAARWPGAVWQREVPISVHVGAGASRRRINGSIDLLLETDDGYVVIDHKTYGNPDEDAIRAHAEQYLAQLAAYGAGIEAATGRRVLGYWVHFGISGVCVGCSQAQCRP